jgi:thiol-disulfide isomerase/thioredoxin
MTFDRKSNCAHKHEDAVRKSSSDYLPWLVATGLSAVPILGCSPPDNSPPPAMYSPTATPSKPLDVGALLPEWKVDGWVNGDPPAPAANGVQLLVVDIWAHWCPYCRKAAPDLVRLHEKYSARGVKFVSVTSMGREAVEAFVGQFSIPWSSGYGMADPMILALGAKNAMPTPGYEVAPTLYLVGRDGRIHWCDSQGRFRHVESPVWIEQLDKAIAAALSELPAEKK